MKIDLPDHLVQSIIDAHIVQNYGSIKSVEPRTNHAQRVEQHVAEIVSAIVIKEVKKHKLLPNK